MLVSNII